MFETVEGESVEFSDHQLRAALNLIGEVREELLDELQNSQPQHPAPSTDGSECVAFHYVVDALDGTFIDVDEGFCALLGRQREDLLSKDVERIMMQGINAYVAHPDVIQKFNEVRFG